MFPYLKTIAICSISLSLTLAHAAESEETLPPPPPPRTVTEAVPDETPAMPPIPTAPITPVAPKKTVQTPAAKSSTATEPKADIVADTPDDDDLISDKPEAVSKDNEKKKPDLLEVIQTTEPLTEKSSKVYELIGEIKTQVDKISSDLDNSGKEITRLQRTSEALAKSITDLAAYWPQNETFNDECAEAKRNVLVLNDELSRAPRRWTHVRWSYNDSVKAIRALRRKARDLAEAEPKPQAVVGRDGKVRYVEPAAPAVDPRIAKLEKKEREVEESRARSKRAEEARKNKSMPLDLDGNKK
jgi:hypothetical protein